MKVLVACEMSGRVRDAFAAKGHDAWSCDLLPTESPGQHIQGDVREVLSRPWDMIIAHPDCTYITNSGVRWLDDPKAECKPGVLQGAARWRAMWNACEFFRLFTEHPCPKVVIENPVPHKYALQWIGKNYTQTIQPWQHGEGYSKRTCLWIKGVPKLEPSDVVSGRIQECWLESPGEGRKANRSRTYKGVAAAFAEQWDIW